MITHYPSGQHPHRSCGYDRIPLNPLEGDTVFIRCIPPEAVDEPLLNLNNGNTISILSGHPDPETADRSYLYKLGSFAKGTRISYSFSFDEDKQYSFTVGERSRVLHCEAVEAGDTFISVLCFLDNNHLVELLFTTEAIRFRLDVRIVPEDAAAGESLARSTARRLMPAEIHTSEGNRLSISMSPLRISLHNASEDCLLSFGIEDLSFCFDDQQEITAYHLDTKASGNGFYGFGEKFDRVNQKGLVVRNIVHETYTEQGHDTYLPTPWLFSDSGWGLFNSSACESTFDLSQVYDDHTRLLIDASVGHNSPDPLYFLFGSPEELLNGLVALSGQAQLPPRWAFGPWISANGWASQSEAMEQIDRLNELDIPATTMVLEAWSDECTFYIWNGAEYTPKENGVFNYADFSFRDDGPWPNPKAFVDTIKENDMHLLLWQIPVIPNGSNEERRNNAQLLIDEREAIENNYCVLQADGSPYRLPDRWFSHSLLLDFTNPEAVSWWMEKRRYLIDELNVEGFKTDGGEFIYDPTLRFANGNSGVEERNLYAAQYTQAYYDYLQKDKRNGILFSRAGYTGSQSRPIHWSGDQKSTFGELRSQLIAGLSAGLSGILFWGYDIGGFAGDLPSSELYLRSAAMGAFSPVMQFHSEPRDGQYGDSNNRDWNNDRSPWNIARVNNDPWVIDKYRDLAKLRMRMLPYIYSEAAYSVSTGRPLLCHLLYDYPSDPNVLDLEDQYLFGRDLLVAPVLEEGVDGRDVYLPEGDWVDFWTGESYNGGTTITVESSPGHIPVFSRKASFTAENLPTD